VSPPDSIKRPRIPAPGLLKNSGCLEGLVRDGGEPALGRSIDRSNASSGDSHEAASSRGSARPPPAPSGRPIGWRPARSSRGRSAAAAACWGGGWRWRGVGVDDLERLRAGEVVGCSCLLFSPCRSRVHQPTKLTEPRGTERLSATAPRRARPLDR
jgi:hypothetical protein